MTILNVAISILCIATLQPAASFLQSTLTKVFNPHLRPASRKFTKMSASSSDRSKLIIWDCDGCLVDSEALLKQAEVDALHKAGFTSVTRDDCNRLFSGFAPEEGAKRFKAEFGKDLPENFFRDQIANSLPLFREKLEGLNTNTVNKLFNDKRPMVVASGSPRDRVLVCLESCGMGNCFQPDEVFTREDVPGRGKPNPDMFLLAASKMGYEPAECVVVEDSAAGVKAALAAGMPVVGFLGGGHATADWYKAQLLDIMPDLPLVRTENELYEYLASK
jgi:beta-phosphoglucomutase-like phosphatase (HAD superfamily)